MTIEKINSQSPEGLLLLHAIALLGKFYVGQSPDQILQLLIDGANKMNEKVKDILKNI